MQRQHTCGQLNILLHPQNEISIIIYPPTFQTENIIKSIFQKFSGCNDIKSELPTIMKNVHICTLGLIQETTVE